MEKFSESLMDLLKIVLPSVIVLYAMYITIRSLVIKETNAKMIDKKAESNKVIFSAKLQALERMCLFLERIRPINLLTRASDNKMSSRQMQQLLTHQIREEFSHNFSQQLYLEEQTWEVIKSAVEELIGIINASAESLSDKAKGVELKKQIIIQAANKENDLIMLGLSMLKQEMKIV